MKNIYDFNDFRSYLAYALPTQGEQRGSRSRLAEKIGVQKGFISSVLAGSAELSLELGYRISSFLSQTCKEREHFLLLIQKSRAGSKELENHYEEKIREAKERQREINERVKPTDKLQEVDQLKYYSHWVYVAIHMCLRVPATQTTHSISRYLKVPIDKVTEALEFLTRTGIAIKKDDHFEVGPTRIHIGSDSPFVTSHHRNWRLQTMQSIDRVNRDDLHYSLVMSISPEVAQQIREILLHAIQTMEPAIKEAKDEVVYALTLDLFSVRA